MSEAATPPSERRRAGGGVARREGGSPSLPVFVFFSNRLGCLGSLAVSAGLTLLLLLVLGVLD